MTVETADTPNESTQTQAQQQAQTTTEPKQKNREMFSREYVEELREENKSIRGRALTAEQTLAQSKTDYEAQLTALQDSTRREIAVTKIEAVAIKEGIIDAEVLDKLLDPTEFKFSDNGRITNAEELVSKLKASKSYLFGSLNSSSTSATPKPEANAAKKVTDMTKEEKAAYYKSRGL